MAVDSAAKSPVEPVENGIGNSAGTRGMRTDVRHAEAGVPANRIGAGGVLFAGNPRAPHETGVPVDTTGVPGQPVDWRLTPAARFRNSQ